MKVSELIDELKKMPQNLEVCYWDEYTYLIIGKVSIYNAYINKNKHKYCENENQERVDFVELEGM